VYKIYIRFCLIKLLLSSVSLFLSFLSSLFVSLFILTNEVVCHRLLKDTFLACRDTQRLPYLVSHSRRYTTIAFYSRSLQSRSSDLRGQGEGRGKNTRKKSRSHVRHVSTSRHPVTPQSGLCNMIMSDCTTSTFAFSLCARP